MSCEDRDHIDYPSYYPIIYSITSGNGHKPDYSCFHKSYDFNHTFIHNHHTNDHTHH